LIYPVIFRLFSGSEVGSKKFREIVVEYHTRRHVDGLIVADSSLYIESNINIKYQLRIEY
jgi:choline dehydrogenase-like flavoprotein